MSLAEFLGTRYQVLAYFRDCQGCWVTIQEVADDTGLNLEYLRYLVPLAYKSGFLVRQQMFSGGRGQIPWGYQLAPGVVV